MGGPSGRGGRAGARAGHFCYPPGPGRPQRPPKLFSRTMTAAALALRPRDERSDERSLEVVTFGCRLNAVESEQVRARALADGVADAVVFNTCAVTGEAV